MSRTMILLVTVLATSSAAPISAAERLLIDFEQGDSLATYKRLKGVTPDAVVVAGGPDGGGHCLKVENSAPSSSCGVQLTGPIPLVKNVVLSFDHRAEIESGFEGAYLGMIFYIDGKQHFWHSDEFSGQWRHASLHLGMLKPFHGNRVRPGIVFSGIRLYARVKDKTPAAGETKARITVHFDNICLETAPRQSALTDRVRESTSNPPMFQWPKHELPAERQRLQYSTDPSFADGATVTVDTRWNFHTPAEPIEPGTWYWRAWTENALVDGWSDIERIEVLPEAHRFTTAETPLDDLARRPRPRLLPLAQLTEPNLSDARKLQLIKNAQKLYKQGVPEHPGPHVPGDPRWPTWIDWYGKVAGGITGRVGRRLEQIGGYAMLTGDPQVIAWAGELALEACRWDPEGGSAMRYGDIGAHHLLRGLNWCYDACCESMSDADRRRLREVIVQRAEQFHGRLNPFRGSEANNHAWLQGLGLAESGIVLAGDHDRAAEWAELVRQLYVGRFLCCLGYQGDNNEGISYWGYGLGFVVGYADLMQTVCGIDLYQHPWLSQTARFPMYTAPPGAWAVSFADTGKPNHAVRGPAQTRWVRALALRTRDPYALWYSGAREPVDGLVPKAPTDLPPSIHYRHIGWAIFNTSLVDGGEGTTVAMHSGRYFVGHQQPDQNSFVIHAYGEKLAIDGGYYDWWGSPHFDAYSMTTLAHNTLLVDGAGQAVRKAEADGRIAIYFDAPGYGYAVGDASAPVVYGGRLDRFDRRILFIKPGFVVVHDLVASAGKPARFDWMLHAIAPIETDATSAAFTVPSKEASLRGRFLSPDGVDLAVTKGFPVEPVDGYSTRPVPPDKYFPEWHLYATPPKPVQEAEFLAAMQIRRLGAEPEPEARIESLEAVAAHGIQIRCGDRTHIILLRTGSAQGAMSATGLQTDGQVAAIELDPDGKVLRAMAIGARTFHYRDQNLLDEDTPQNWAMP